IRLTDFDYAKGTWKGPNGSLEALVVSMREKRSEIFPKPMRGLYGDDLIESEIKRISKEEWGKPTNGPTVPLFDPPRHIEWVVGSASLLKIWAKLKSFL
ncbi:hypothetical protein HAX54_010684, partial [Datura stramonium]|nr:hypothetical protein [Datura stramonium]